MARYARSISIVVALMATCGSAFAWAPPTDEQIAKVGTAIQNAYKEMGEKYDQAKVEAAAKEAMKDLDLSEATAAQIGKLKGTGAIDMAGLGEVAEKRLTTLAADSTADGARAAGQLMSFLPNDIYDEAKQGQYLPSVQAKLKGALEHPGFGELVKANERITALESLRMISGKNVAGFAPIVFGLEKYITPDLGVEPAGSMVTALMALAESEGVDAKSREAFRAKLATAVDAQVKAASEGDEKLRKRLVRRQQTVNGAFVKGELVGHPVPKMNITWSNLSGNPQTVSDLKGKVVVLDFWATWCGPCIGSFPQVRELAARYKGYDVVILGVTSLQGNHYSQSLAEPGKRDVVKTEGEPKKEYDLMTGFMKDMDMTWNVAFTEQDVFNPDFGVNGIPHVAIVDAKGIVRYRGMHPASEPEKKYGMIDGLLKEAGLKAPAPAPKGEAKNESAGG